jgi:acetyl esterase/lipase
MHSILKLAIAASLLASPSARAETVGERIAAQTAVDVVQSRETTAVDGATVAYPNGVTALPGRVYATLRGYRPLTLDLYLPPKRFAGPRPVIFFIHGGGWIYGNPRHEAAFADWPRTLADMAGEGYVVAAVSYRLGSEAPFPAALRDLKAAARWLRAHAADYRIDKDRFVSWGGSAGGQLSAMLATTCGVAKFEPELGDGFGANLTPPPIAKGAMPESDCVQGAVAWYGAYDFTRPIGGPLPIERHPYFPCEKTVPCPRAVLEDASAAFFVDAKDPPMLLVHGAGDKSAPLSQSEHFLDVLKENSVPARLEVIPGVDHGWIGATPEETRAASRHALALSLDFTQSVIGDRKSGR